MISLIAKVVAHFRVNKIKKTYTKATKIQDHILRRLVKKAKNTKFGKDHEFAKISNYDNEDAFLKLVKDITSKGFVRNNYKDKLVDLSNVRINLKSNK